jgi:hypothetical protein
MTTVPDPKEKSACEYSTGQPVLCRIEEEQPGGFMVTVLSPPPGQDDVGQVSKPGFLGSERIYKQGDVVMAQFVCATGQQLLLTENIAVPSGAARGAVDAIDPTLARLCGVQKYKLYTYKAIGTTSPIRLKRAVDLIPTAARPEDVVQVETGRHGPRLLIDRLESGKFTGVLKVHSEERLSRSAMLILQGRVAGCHYACKELPYLVSTEGALQLALGDISFARTNATLYPLPDPIILSLASLFIGRLEEHEHDERAAAAMGTICKELAAQRATACIAITWPPSEDMCFVFINDGQIHGAFRVDDRQLSTDPEFAFDLLKRNGKASLQAMVLPEELRADPASIGFPLREESLQVD